MMSDSFPYSGANAAEARRYALNRDEMRATCTQGIHVPANPAVVCTPLQFADDRRQCGRDDGLTEWSGRKTLGRFCRIPDGLTHLVERGQESAEHEGGKHDGEVILWQDMGLALFPSGARLCLLFLPGSRRREGELEFFFRAGHIPVRAMNHGGRGTGSAHGTW